MFMVIDGCTSVYTLTVSVSPVVNVAAMVTTYVVGCSPCSAALAERDSHEVINMQNMIAIIQITNMIKNDLIFFFIRLLY
tara:strand:- start:323 stop:562 length:240 start_codon:yes stop_codon:yes gene_type:complete